FFVPPRWTFEVESREHLISLFAMLTVALVISHLASALRRETAAARLNEKRARQLQELATTLADVSDPEVVMSTGRQAFDAAFFGPSVIAGLNSQGELDAAPELRDGMLCCIREAATLGPGTGRWP